MEGVALSSCSMEASRNNRLNNPEKVSCSWWQPHPPFCNSPSRSPASRSTVDDQAYRFLRVFFRCQGRWSFRDVPLSPQTIPLTEGGFHVSASLRKLFQLSALIGPQQSPIVSRSGGHSFEGAATLPLENITFLLLPLSGSSSLLLQVSRVTVALVHHE